MKISLALSGGAARGAFHLGVLQAIDELGIEVEAISGSSIGAIIGASYACGVSPKEQLEIFASREFKKAFKLNYFQNGFFSIDERKEVINKLVPCKRVEDTKIDLYITTMDLNTGDIIRFNEGDLKTLCIASSALVPMFKPIEYKEYNLADGGVMDNLPIEPLEKYAYPIVGVDLHPLQKNYKKSFSGIIKRTLFLMWRASVKKNLESIDIYVSDDKLSDFSLFSFKKLQKLFDLGYERGYELLSHL